MAETYVHDVDGNPVVFTCGGQTTVYAFGLWEDTLGVSQRKLYTFGGQVIAQREGASTLLYLHGDHLGSVSLTTDANGSSAQWQYYTPWGQHRAEGTPNTTLNFTGQRRDSTGLLYYR